MRLLLDTHVAIWLYQDEARIRSETKSLLFEADAIYLSAVSAWEYGHKRLIKPGELPVPFDILAAKIPALGLDFAFQLHHFAESLPLIHRDPFDRMLIAQAVHHELTLVTSDRHIRQYPVPTIW